MLRLLILNIIFLFEQINKYTLINQIQQVIMAMSSRRYVLFSSRPLKCSHEKYFIHNHWSFAYLIIYGKCTKGY